MNNLIVSAIILAAAAMAGSHPTVDVSYELDWMEPRTFCGAELTNFINQICNEHGMEKREIDEIPEEFPEFPSYSDGNQEVSKGEQHSLTIECCLLPCYPKQLKAYCTNNKQGAGTEHSLFVYKNKYVMRPMYENNSKRLVKIEQSVNNLKTITTDTSTPDETTTITAKETNNKKVMKTFNKPKSHINNAKMDEDAARIATINSKYMAVDEGRSIVSSVVKGKATPPTLD